MWVNIYAGGDSQHACKQVVGRQLNLRPTEISSIQNDYLQFAN